MTNNAKPDVFGSAAAVAHNERPRDGKVKKVLRFLPGFFYLFVFYVVVAVSVNDVRAPFLSFGPYALSWVEVLLILGAIISLFELMRVSKPGIDNTYEAIGMGGVFVLYLIFFVLASSGQSSLRIFGNTEFLTLLVISLSQTIVAFIINARTLKRTIDYTGGEG